jgi:hypothetical protein
METNDKRCLICQEPLDERHEAYCCLEHQREAHRRRLAYYRRYGTPLWGQKVALQTLPHRRYELQLPGCWIDDKEHG